MTRTIFWAAALLLAFTYVGYPLLMALRARLARRTTASAVAHAGGAHADETPPMIDVLLVTCRAGAQLQAKLDNLRQLDYPAHRMRINVALDGTDPEAEATLSQPCNRDVRVFADPLRQGKSACLGRAIPQLDGDLVLFTDVRQRLDPRCAAVLAATLDDPRVGAASGELVLHATSGYGQGVDAYWRFEKTLRRLESASGSIVGVTGALYAARRTSLPPVPPGIILDDMWIPLSIAARGERVVFVPQAIAHDRAALDPAEEERRKRRTLAGNFQLIHRWPGLLLPGAHPLAWRLWGHKWLRLLAPWLLIALLLASLRLAVTGSAIYIAPLALQLLAYALALLGRYSRDAARRSAAVRTCTAFASLNLCALLALRDYLTAGDGHLWTSPVAGKVRT